MVDKKILDDLNDLGRHLSEAVPESVREIGGDLEKTFRDILQSGFSKLDLVTREEFDAQAGVLARTREKLEALEKRVKDLEEKC